MNTFRQDNNNALANILLPIAFTLFLLILWEILVRALHVREFILPAPSRILEDCYQVRGSMLTNTLATCRTIALGFLISVVVSFPIALAISSSRLLSAAIYPVLVVTQSVPKIAIAPLLVVMLGANEIPRLVVTFLVAFFPLVISISTGFINLPDEYRNLAFVYKTTRYRKFLDIELPYAVPYIFSGLKMAATLAVVGAVTAEFVNADKGLGYLIVTSTAYFKTTIAFGAVVILSLLGIGFFQLISVIENIFLRKYRG